MHTAQHKRESHTRVQLHVLWGEKNDSQNTLKLISCLNQKLF